MPIAAAAMPNAAFVPLAGLDHVQAFLRADLVVPPAKAFLDRVGTAEQGRAGESARRGRV